MVIMRHLRYLGDQILEYIERLSYRGKENFPSNLQIGYTRDNVV